VTGVELKQCTYNARQKYMQLIKNIFNLQHRNYKCPVKIVKIPPCLFPLKLLEQDLHMNLPLLQGGGPDKSCQLLKMLCEMLCEMVLGVEVALNLIPHNQTVYIL
jgi:hypothetical protein